MWHDQGTGKDARSTCPGKTPVGVVKDAFRPGQQVTITDLEGLEGIAEDINMVTTVVIGNSTTYVLQGHMATPRGYRDK